MPRGPFFSNQGPRNENVEGARAPKSCGPVATKGQPFGARAQAPAGPAPCRRLCGHPRRPGSGAVRASRPAWTTIAAARATALDGTTGPRRAGSVSHQGVGLLETPLGRGGGANRPVPVAAPSRAHDIAAVRPGLGGLGRHLGGLGVEPGCGIGIDIVRFRRWTLPRPRCETLRNVPRGPGDASISAVGRVGISPRRLFFPQG